MIAATIDITKALAIQGWMSESELLWLAEQAREHSVIVEIGSYLGRSTRAMLDHTNGVVYAVDDWRGPRDVYMPKEERVGLYRKFISSVAEFYHIGRLKTIVCDHSRDDFDLNPDMVFIDGEHTYEAVKRDIEIWKPKIKAGGLICGHDIDQPDVQKAVLATIGDAEIVDNTTIWWKIVK